MPQSFNIDYLKPCQVLFENKLDLRPVGKTDYDDDIGSEDWTISRFICSCKSLTAVSWFIDTSCCHTPHVHLPATPFLPLHFQLEKPVVIKLMSLRRMSQLIPVCGLGLEEKVISMWQCNYCPLWSPCFIVTPARSKVRRRKIHMFQD